MPDVVRFTFDSATAQVAGGVNQQGEPRRAIEGVAVPWNTVARVSNGTLVKFLPGSVSLAGEAVVRDHDRTRPIGIVSSEEDTGAGLHIATKVSATVHGDEALVLAGDGVLKHWSVGVNPTRYSFEDTPDGMVLVVEEADADEVSLLVKGAYGAAAAVTRVAASEPAQEAPVPDPVEATAVAPAVIPVTPAAPKPATPPLTLRRMAQIVAGADHGSVATALERAVIEAAPLADVTTTGAAGVVQPAFISEITGLIRYGRPFVEGIARGTLPSTGMKVEWPDWTTLPVVDVHDAQKTQIPTGPVVIDTVSADVHTFAGGNDIAIQLAQRSSPSFMENYFQACAEIMARKQNTYVQDAILGAAAAAVPAATFTANVQALFAALDPTGVPDGPFSLFVAWDVFVKTIGLKEADRPAFWDGRVNFGSMVPELSTDGLTTYVDRTLGAGEMALVSRNAAVWHEDPANPYEVRAVDVGLLGVNAGVYGFAALRETYPWAKAAATLTWA